MSGSQPSFARLSLGTLSRLRPAAPRGYQAFAGRGRLRRANARGAVYGQADAGAGNCFCLPIVPARPAMPVPMLVPTGSGRMRAPREKPRRRPSIATEMRLGKLRAGSCASTRERRPSDGRKGVGTAAPLWVTRRAMGPNRNRRRHRSLSRGVWVRSNWQTRGTLPVNKPMAPVCLNKV